MPVHTVIRQKRMELGLTQEQAAQRLNVTAAAVSKWERGLALPDVALLPALARLLGTDINTLLCFREEMTPQEMGGLCRELAALADGDLERAFSLAQEKIRDYPQSGQLMLSAAVILDAALLRSGKENAQLDAVIDGWAERLITCGEESVSSSACCLQAARHMRRGKPEEAQRMLDALPPVHDGTGLYDRLMLQVSVYLSQSRAQDAALALEEELARGAERMQQLLMRLAEAELEAGCLPEAEEIAKRTQAVAALLDQRPYTGYAAMWMAADRKGDKEQALCLMKAMLDSLERPWRREESVLYRRMGALPPSDCGKTMRAQLLRALEREAQSEGPDARSLYEELIRSDRPEAE